MTVLIIEDDATLNKNISNAFASEDWSVQSVFDGELAERILRKNSFDCLVMDINLPGKNGFELCKAFREKNQDTPVLMLTAFADLEDRVEGFDCGADDYLTKPFFMRELIIRVKKLVERNHKKRTSANGDELLFDDICIRRSKKQVFRQGKEILLTPREYNILLQLMQNPTEIISKRDLVKSIWGSALDFNTNTIEVYINFLRNKLDKPFGKNTIKTKIGYGYYIEAR